MTVVLFWDIDGTLLTTARAGVFALEAAADEVCGVPPDYAGLQTAGLTDSEVAELSIRAVGREPEPPLVSAFLRVYERELPRCLHLRKGYVIPGVVDILENMSAGSGVRQLLLTGNTAPGAAAKLEHYGLADYFDGGAFCRDGDNREAIARRALDLVGGSADGVYVIGDTPHDIRCGNAIGARVLALASGSYPIADLEQSGAWQCLAQLPPPDEFRRLIGIEEI